MNVYRIYVDAGRFGAEHERQIESEKKLTAAELNEMASQLREESVECGFEIISGDIK